MLVLALAIGLMVLLHQQVTIRAYSIMTILTDIKSDLHIYKVKRFKNLRMYKFMKMSWQPPEKLAVMNRVQEI